MKYQVKAEKIEITLDNPMSVYEFLVGKVFDKELRGVDEETHIRAADAQCWCELANAGDRYETDMFTIECVYSFR